MGALAAAPKRGGDVGTPVKPIAANFPRTSEKTMGPHGFGRGSYTIKSISSPIVGPIYRPPWVVGGIHNPTIDPVKHFNTQHRLRCSIGTGDSGNGAGGLAPG